MITHVNIAYYEKKDWDFLLSVISDREKMHDTWEDWFKDFIKLKAGLTAEGLEVRAVTIDINDLVNYCVQRKIKIDGAARSQYVQTK
jgi:hypothetical protein